jgi:hypothetical protein
MRLDLTPPGVGTRVDPTSDAGLVAGGYASLTALVGVREADTDEAADTLGLALDALYALPGVESGPPPDDERQDAGAADN